MWLKEYSTLDISYSALLTPLYTYNRGFTYLLLHAISSGKRCLGTFLNAHSSRGNLASNASLNLHSILPIAQVGSRLKACLSVSRVTSSLREGASFKWNVGFRFAHVGRWLYARVRETIRGGGNINHRWEDRVKLRRRIEHERRYAFFDLYPRRFSYSN